MEKIFSKLPRITTELIMDGLYILYKAPNDLYFLVTDDNVIFQIDINGNSMRVTELPDYARKVNIGFDANKYGKLAANG